jgi:hypothetical protein
MTPTTAGAYPRIDVVGGVYREWCMRPSWREIYGSAGRAAVAMASMGASVRLHAYMDQLAKDSMAAQAALNGFEIAPRDATSAVAFDYVHGLATPRIFVPAGRLDAIEVRAENIVRFGMLESDAMVHGDTVVYDPQNAVHPAPFTQNGSTARRLALILNRHEASLMTGLRDAPVREMAKALIADSQAAVVVIKQGPLGAFVLDGNEESAVPAYRSGNVWKIGSGDNFVAHFAYRWISEGRPAAESADLASRATAYYCSTVGFATHAEIDGFAMPPIRPSAQYVAGRKPKVYLAGPFFTLAQRWLIEEARNALSAMGLRVFSPFHDVGHGSADDIASKDLAAIENADLVFALGDSLEPGTVYELGHARRAGKPVVVYCENESDGDKKMMLGSGCHFHTDFVSAIYNASWTACEL